jgi:hypothetical protein
MHSVTPSRRLVLATILVLAASGARTADDPLVRVRQMAGTWLVVDEKGAVTDQVASVFRVTSNGHSVEETMFPGTEHEMVNMYYRDQDEVRMTHYCAGGNQPTVRLLQAPKADVVQLEFVGATNLESTDQEHMHEGQYQWLGPDRVRTEWRSFKDGRPIATQRFEMVRRRP